MGKSPLGGESSVGSIGRKFEIPCDTGCSTMGGLNSCGVPGPTTRGFVVKKIFVGYVDLNLGGRSLREGCGEAQDRPNTSGCRKKGPSKKDQHARFRL